MYKIWGTTFGLIGDLVMSLPQLTYFEKKYPGSYKYFVIQKKIAHCAPLFFNHPLIDRIKITDHWGDFGEEDYKLASECDFSTRKIDHDLRKVFNSKSVEGWYNSVDCIQHHANVNGIPDLKEVLTEDELYPKLYKWFDADFSNTENNEGYSRNRSDSGIINKNSIAIWPFAAYGRNTGRSLDVSWWKDTIKRLIAEGFEIYHFGWVKEPRLSEDSNYHYHTGLEFFEQVKVSLGCDFSIGTDSGSMWVLGAYSHPFIVLNGPWMPGHTQNFGAFLPPNKKGKYIVKLPNINYIQYSELQEKIREIV